MLPANRHKHDEKWLAEQYKEIVRLAGFQYANSVMAKYSAAYLERLSVTNENHKKHNAARRECNTRLRLVIRTLTQRCEPPPMAG